MKEPIVIGKVLKPRGLRGEIKCSLSFNAPFEKCRIGGTEYKVTKSSDYDGFTFLFLDTVTTVEQAERLRNKTVEIDRADMALSEDEILTSDLLGFDIWTTDGRLLGSVVSVDDNGAGEIIVSENFSFPYEDNFVAETSMSKARILVYGEMLESELCE